MLRSKLIHPLVILKFQLLSKMSHFVLHSTLLKKVCFLFWNFSLPSPLHHQSSLISHSAFHNCPLHSRDMHAELSWGLRNITSPIHPTHSLWIQAKALLWNQTVKPRRLCKLQETLSWRKLYSFLHKILTN